MEWQSLSKEDCTKKLGTNMKTGLSSAQAYERLKKYGKNELQQPKRKSLLLRFFAQFSDFMVIVLLIAAGISFVTSFLEHDNDYIDSIIILFIVTMNAIIGLVQESRAEKAIDALKKLSSPHAHVIRGGEERLIAAAELVPGDLVVLREGDLVPADLRLIEAVNLKAEESALTGESLPGEKRADFICPVNTPLGDRCNLLYTTSSIASGHGKGIVTTTGMDTQVGKIAHMITSQSAPQTPLQKKLAQTGRWLGIGALVICFIIFVMGLFQHIRPIEMFLISISLAVAAIPEGLPAVVTIVLAIGVRRMAAHRGIVRRMPAVETLGSASVICSDKTGTLTQNRMTVVELKDASGPVPMHTEHGRQILDLASLCCNCTVSGKTIHGDPTEVAIVAAAPAEKNQLDALYPRIREIPFSSERKMMTTVHRLEGNRFRIISKGAPDILFTHCTNAAPRQNEEMASRALRVIGVAYRDVDFLPQRAEEMESGLTFCGLIGMIDPPRPQVKSAVELCKKAGILPVMITGDHAATAAAIAKQLGILDGNKRVITGTDLNALSQKELERNIYQYTVFARVSPEHKVRIVKAFQAHGEVVAMTGDGVNDAPALRAADIGCAMGISGTDVAKAASDMILTDDNFATIVAAVREGRGIYENIKKTVHFLLSCNIGEILTVFVSFLLRLPTPLLAIQLLWVNLVTDSLPALALGVEPIDKNIMDRKPIKPNESIFSGGMGYNILVEGCLIGTLSLLAYSIGRIYFDLDPSMPVIGRTMAFAVLSLSQVVHTFNMRSSRSIFEAGIFANPKLVLAAIACVALQLAVIVIQPLSVIFKTAMLTGYQWLIVALLSFIPLAVVELEKAIAFRNEKQR
ncbi:calcium-translocating P-type ATPase, PMCA-type [Caproiciproducens galactitolivorans]|uniref:P-type Ca(2+) transporter n=1 Tax=Caproiciproducens galactitolivorans TaxID=642589 RepID=A0ABT4BU64_9FIRM|nr:calcium-translocating P-type ATPase, PMCA-type [Caproiciproducens galactitolivorans]MCY1714436.1 calcium-translocating P-type ATPase, PMCA-type [Caproiciproducens galactitolivorans]